MSQSVASKVHSLFPHHKVETWTFLKVEIRRLSETFSRCLFPLTFPLTGFVRVAEQRLLLSPEPVAGPVLHPGGDGEVVG